MTTEIQKQSWVILMKNGMVHWVEKGTAEKAAEHLANQTSHSFLRIRELGNATINSAEISGIYSPLQYDDYTRVKNGDWQCSYRRWHPRRGECQCKAESMRRTYEQRPQPQEKELTSEQRENMNRQVERDNQLAALGGSPIFRGVYRRGNAGRKMIGREAIEEWEKKNGRAPDLAGLEVEQVEEEGEQLSINTDDNANNTEEGI